MNLAEKKEYAIRRIDRAITHDGRLCFKYPKDGSKENYIQNLGDVCIWGGFTLAALSRLDIEIDLRNKLVRGFGTLMVDGCLNRNRI